MHDSLDGACAALIQLLQFADRFVDTVADNASNVSKGAQYLSLIFPFHRFVQNDSYWV